MVAKSLFFNLSSTRDLGCQRNLLYFYGILLYHLTPYYILHISIFINLCKANLSIDPHFNLFRYFFCLKPLFGQGAQKIIGGVYLVLCDEMANQYKMVPLNSLVKN